MFAALLMSLGLISNSAQAQSNNFASDQLRHEREVHIGFKVPFGTTRKDAKAAPRLALSIRNYQQSSQFANDWVLRPHSSVAEFGFSENVLALSISQSPELFVNGESFYLSDPESANLGKSGKTALGIGAAVVVAAGVYVLIFAACHGDGEEPKC